MPSFTRFFFYNQHFYKQRQPEIGKKSPKLTQPARAPFFCLSKFFSEQLALSVTTTATTTTIQYYR